MSHSKYPIRLAAALFFSALLTLPISAQELTVDSTAQFCFSGEDFSTLSDEDGIFITAVPNSRIAKVCYGERVLKAGDALPKEALKQLTLYTDCVTEQSTSVEYYTVSNGKVSGTKALTLSILPQKNDPPTAEDSSLETYKNIANTGELHASDPEGSTLTYTLVDEPKRGTVELHTDGTFTYTPNKNKVGNDRFTFTATDNAGNTSNQATVSIKIKKPSDKEVYADMTDDPDAFVSMWLKEEGIFSGTTIGNHLCFSPEQTVSRGEFLVMVMKLVDADANMVSVSSGFSDEAETPSWMQPYITSALSNGMISGTSSEDGVRFRPTDDLTKAETAVMLQNILKLPSSDTTPVFSQEDASVVPTWAASSVSALSQAGIYLNIATDVDLLTRRDAANVLYSLSQLMDTETLSMFYWVQ